MTDKPTVGIFVPANSALRSGLNRVTSIGRHGNQTIFAAGNHIFEFPTEEAQGLSPTDALISAKEILVNYRREQDRVKMSIKTNDESTNPEWHFYGKDFIIGEEHTELRSDIPYPIIAIEQGLSETMLILRFEEKYLLHKIRNREGSDKGIIDTLGPELMLATGDPQKYVFVIRTDKDGYYHAPRIERTS